MALELFKPFIYAKLELYGMATTIKAAKRMLEKERPEVWDILEEVIREHPVMLNRAPTLHRLGIQAFEPVLIEGKAIQLHPLVCAAFNADFDGDQMAVHVPLSLEAQLEARVLMMSTNNILSPASGKPIITPSQDIVLGLYYMTMERDGEKGEGMAFLDAAEIQHALDSGAVSLQAKVQARYHTVDENGDPIAIRVQTTPGRMILSDILPRNKNIPFDIINRLQTKKEITNVIDEIYRHCGQKETVIFCDRMMGLGFSHACRAGISFGKDDLIIPETKEKLVADTETLVKQYEQQYQEGLITQGEKYNKAVDAWSNCTDVVADEMMSRISKLEDGKQMNSVYMMAHSGARGSAAQMKQLAGMRGLMAKPNGEIIETPIISNFKEGLTVLEYFNSTHGARKGLADTALKTANSGYLTRRLVDVAQDCIIRERDCKTEDGITVQAVVAGGEIISPLSERILGRSTALDILHPETGEVILPAGGLIVEETCVVIDAVEIESLKIRSVLTCTTDEGVCGVCYGRDLARGTEVNAGEAVGVIAAQSIGEPGTQLTMRTFHIGGAAQRGTEQSNIEATISGKISLTNCQTVKNSDGVEILMSRNGEIAMLDDQGRERSRQRVPYGARLLVKDKAKVKRDTKLAEWDPYTLPVISEKEGYASFVDLVDGISVTDRMDEATGISTRVVIDWKQQPKGSDLKPRVTIRDEDGEVIMLENDLEARYFLSMDAVLSVAPGQKVYAGDILARIPRESAKTRDITGGLPRVAELFEARKPKDYAIIAENEGRVEFGKDYKNKRRIVVVPTEGDSEPVEYLIPKGKHISVQEGDYVLIGDSLMDGNPVPHDILRILGVEALAEYLINEIQDVYRLQGVTINDKHIEVIVRQMLQKVEVNYGGDTTLLIGELVDRKEFEKINNKAVEEGGEPAAGDPVLQGITKASLQTHSFISAASFQETTRVLTEAAVSGKIDTLIGLKENVIVGRPIPAGTGARMNQFREVAEARDNDMAALEAKHAAVLVAEAKIDAFSEGVEAETAE
jgi:DNA-directed RNA polymerase subunit beta'